eukprot:gene30871-38692_t
MDGGPADVEWTRHMDGGPADVEWTRHMDGGPADVDCTRHMDGGFKRTMAWGLTTEGGGTGREDAEELAWRIKALCAAAKRNGTRLVLPAVECDSPGAVTVFDWPALRQHTCYPANGYDLGDDDCPLFTLAPFELEDYLGSPGEAGAVWEPYTIDLMQHSVLGNSSKGQPNETAEAAVAAEDGAAEVAAAAEGGAAAAAAAAEGGAAEVAAAAE